MGLYVVDTPNPQKGKHMPKHNLQFLEKLGTSVVFFDPQNIDNRFTHSVVNTRRPVGKTKVRQTKNEFSMVRHYGFDACGDKCTINDFVGGRVVLYGVTPKEIMTAWDDIKANVDIALAKGALQGVPLAINTDNLVITDKTVAPATE